MGGDGSPSRCDLPHLHSSSSAQSAPNIVLSTAHVKRDSAGAVKREKRTGVGPQCRKRAPSVLDRDGGIAVYSGDETDLADHLGLVEAIPAPSIAPPLEDRTVEEAMSLGAQGDALLAAINASLGVKIDGVSSQVAAVANRVEVVEKQVVATNRTVEHQGAFLRSSEAKRLLATVPVAAPTLGKGSVDHHSQLHQVAVRPQAGDENDLSRVLEKQFRLPIKRRRLVVLGGFPSNTDGADTRKTQRVHGACTTGKRPRRLQ